MTLLGNNSGLSGGLTVNAGTVNFSADNQLGAPGASVKLSGTATSGGVLAFTSNSIYEPGTAQSLTVTRPTTVVGGMGILSVTARNNRLTWAGDISGTARLSKAGIGTLVLSGNNSFTGNVTITFGTLVAARDAALGDATNAVVLNSSSVFQPGSSFSTSRNFLLTNTNNSTIHTDGFDLTINGQPVANQTNTPFTKTGNGNLTLTGVNTINSSVTLGATGAGRSTGSSFAQPGGTLTLSGANGALAEAVGYTLNMGTTLHLDNSSAINQNRLGSSTITMSGGELKLTGNAAGTMYEHLGGASASSGIDSSTLGNTITVVQPSSGGANLSTNLIATGYGTTTGTTLFRGTNLGSASASVDKAVIRFVTAPTLTPASTGIIASGLYANTATGDAQDFATYNATNGVIAFASYVNLPASGGTSTTTYSLAGSQTLSGSYSGNALKMNGGALDLAGNNLTLGAGALLSVGTDTITNSTPSASLAFSTSLARITVNSSLTIGSVANPVTVSGSGGVNKFGPGTLELSASSITAGGYAVSQGTLRLLQASAFTSGQTVTIAPGATFDLNNTGTIAAPVGTMALAGFGTVAIGSGALATGSTFTTYGGAFTGNGNFIHNGAGFTQTLNGNSPGFSGGVRILAGTLAVDTDVRPTDGTNPGALGTGTSPVQLGDTTGTNAATLLLNANIRSFERDLLVPAGVANTTLFTLSTAFAGPPGNFTGNITLGRELRLNNVGTSGPLTITGNITENVAGAGTLNWANGSVNLWGTNSYAGRTYVNASTSNVLGIGSGPIVIANSASTGNFRADNGARTMANTLATKPARPPTPSASTAPTT